MSRGLLLSLIAFSVFTAITSYRFGVESERWRVDRRPEIRLFHNHASPRRVTRIEYDGMSYLVHRNETIPDYDHNRKRRGVSWMIWR